MLSKSFLAMLRARQTKKNGELKKLKKPPKWLEPLTAERGYIASLAYYTFQIRKTITLILLPKIPTWLRLATMDYPDPVEINIKNDDLIDDILADLERTLLLINQILQEPEQEAIESAEEAGETIARFNERQFKKSVDSVLAVDIFQDEPWLETQLDLFAKQNATLINNLTNEELNRVAGIVQRGLQQGSTYDTVADQIQETFGITRRHAKLIARDQTTKLNANLTKLRQEELGITLYTWQTSNDERVRKTHKVLDGKTCRWDDPTVFYDEKSKKWVNKSTIGGDPHHVGISVNCRCQAIADFSTIFN
jgi:SPP1 gp7 family putative phage head morphogenesis protein